MEHYASTATGIRRPVLKLALIGLAAAFACISLYVAAFPSSFHIEFLRCRFSFQCKEQQDMVQVLDGASMENRTVILTTINQAWSTPNSTFDLFLESFRIGSNTSWLLNHLVVVALDQEAYARCKAAHPHCYSLTTPGSGFSSDAYFMTPRYLEMMWTRIHFLHTVLRLGYNFVFTDADVMWLRNPFHHFFHDSDFQIACDHFNGNSSDASNAPNGGFNYVLSNKRTVRFYQFWYQSRNNYPGLHDQDVLNNIKHHPMIKEIGLKMRFLDTLYYGGFCESSKDFSEVCTMHANCCKGLDNKVHDLTLVLRDWQAYLNHSSHNATISWRAPDKCWV